MKSEYFEAVNRVLSDLAARRWDVEYIPGMNPTTFYAGIPEGADTSEWKPELRDFVKKHIGRYGWRIEEQGGGDFWVKLNPMEIVLPFRVE
jgi:hypothetical protein